MEKLPKIEYRKGSSFHPSLDRLKFSKFSLFTSDFTLTVAFLVLFAVRLLSKDLKFGRDLSLILTTEGDQGAAGPSTECECEHCRCSVD